HTTSPYTGSCNQTKKTNAGDTRTPSPLCSGPCEGNRPARGQATNKASRHNIQRPVLPCRTGRTDYSGSQNPPSPADAAAPAGGCRPLCSVSVPVVGSGQAGRGAGQGRLAVDILQPALLLAQALLRALLGAFGAGLVDVLGPFRRRDQHAGIVRHDLGQALGHHP